MLLLEEIYKSNKAQNSAHFNLRIHRGLSWFKKALELDQDLEFKFISLWISFHAIYANDGDNDPDKLYQFIESLCQKDMDRKIDKLVWEKCLQPIHSLLDNQYMDQCFWDYRNQKVSIERYRKNLEAQQQRIQVALQARNSVEILAVIFHRLYTLHYQLMHGGATYHSALNQKSLQDSCRVLAALLPAFICILLENAAALDLGQPFYPAAQVC